MMNHTPGPWEYGRANAYEDARLVIRRLDGTEVAGLAWRASRKELAANARLIAAAPEMLAALREMDELYAAEERADPLVCRPHGCNLHAGMEQARAAIAKATGAEQ